MFQLENHLNRVLIFSSAQHGFRDTRWNRFSALWGSFRSLQREQSQLQKELHVKRFIKCHIIVKAHQSRYTCRLSVEHFSNTINISRIILSPRFMQRAATKQFRFPIFLVVPLFPCDPRSAMFTARPFRIAPRNSIVVVTHSRQLFTNFIRRFISANCSRRTWLQRGRESFFPFSRFRIDLEDVGARLLGE